MNKYELTVVYSPELTEIKQKKALTGFEALVAKQKGKVVSKDHWGKKTLAYQIKKKSEGFFAHWVVELPKTGPAAISQEMRVDDKVLRYLCVKTSKEKSTTGKKEKTMSKEQEKMTREQMLNRGQRRYTDNTEDKTEDAKVNKRIKRI